MTLNHCFLRLACLMGMIVMSVGYSKEGKGDGDGTGKVPVVPGDMVEVEGGSLGEGGLRRRRGLGDFG